jgi:hypothetical protein
MTPKSSLAALTFGTLCLLVSAPLSAASRVDDGLALVPSDAASVGVIRCSDLRTSPLSARLFSETDKIAVDGDAGRFLEETGLRPKEDVDVITVAHSPKASGGNGGSLVTFEGRFDAEKLSAAVASRGATKKTSSGGDYFLLHEKASGGGPADAAIAFASKHLVIAGSEDAVVAALAQRGSGGTTFRAGNGLGRHLSQIDSGASAWALVDLSRYPVGGKLDHVHADGDANIDGTPISGIVGAVKNVSLLAVQATVQGDSLKLGATGLSDNEDTRELLENAIKGGLAAWRLAAQEKSPDTVAVLRKFKVQRDAHGVSVSGTLPGAAVRMLADSHHD